MSEKKLLVGYGRVEITPNYSLPLAGYGNTMTRMSQGCLDGLFATCIAMTGENGETVLAITVDVCATFTAMTEPLLTSISSATGVPAEHIMVSATHTHSGPDILSEYDNNMSTWKKDYIGGITAAAVAAMADRRPAGLLLGDVQAKGMNFVRHVILGNGTYAGDNFGDFGSAPIVGYATQADSQVQIVRFVREGERDVVLVNFQAHPKMASTIATKKGRSTRGFISADYIAPLRRWVEEQTGTLFAFFQGAAGNLNPISHIKADTPTTDYLEYGKMLGEIVVGALNGLHEAEIGEVKAKRTAFVGKMDHSENCMVEDARRIKALWEETNDYKRCAAEGKPFGIISPYHALAIVRRFEDPETERAIPVTAAGIGALGFVTAPYEMFDTNGKFVKEHSPCEMTFILSCTNGSNGYIASEPAFEYGSYEVHNRVFVRGTGEELANTMVDMLGDVKC